jgi:hypothetical protein
VFEVSLGARSGILAWGLPKWIHALQPLGHSRTLVTQFAAAGVPRRALRRTTYSRIEGHH